MKKLLIGLVCITPIMAHADVFYVLAGYTCDTRNDRVLLTYDGAYNEAGKALVAGKTKTQWEPWSLITMANDDDHIKSVKTVRGNCRLSDGIYQVAINASPGNFNIQGRCGAWITAGATVKKRNRTIYSISRFEKDCQDMDSPVTTRVIIQAGKPAPPEVRTVKWDEFYK